MTTLSLVTPPSVYYIMTTFICILASSSSFLHGGQKCGPPVLSPYDNLRLASTYFLHGGQKCGPPRLLDNDDLTLGLLILFSQWRTQMRAPCLSPLDDPRLSLLLFFLHGAYECEPTVYLIMTTFALAYFLHGGHDCASCAGILKQSMGARNRA
jgi:hypothetical protein